MSHLLSSIGLAEIVAGVMILALDAYVLTGGADFGGGVWEMLARGPRRDAQRALISRAIGPIWEANHVWLIVVVVVLFTGFPATFAALGTVLHVPLALMLVGIVLRGSAFVFRSYGSRDDAAQRRWGRVFAIASTATPFLLGVVVGTIASGNAGRALRRVAAVGGLVPFADVYLKPWLAPFPLVVGAMALALFAFLAAVYLALAAEDAALRDDFRRRALGSAVAVFATAAGALAIAARHAPHVVARLLGGPLAIALQLAIAVAALGAIFALWTRRWRLARLAAAAQVSLILWGWVVVQYPWTIPGAQTIRGAAAPTVTLELLLWGLAGGTVILVPSLVYLYRTFATARVQPAVSAREEGSA